MSENRAFYVYCRLYEPGFYLRKTRNLADKVGYKLFDKSHNPIIFIQENQAAPVVAVCRMDKNGHLTLAMAKVRGLHGNSRMKKTYRAWLKQQKRKPKSQTIKPFE